MGSWLETRALRELAKFLIQAIGRIASNGPVPDFVCPDRRSEGWA